MDTIKKYSLLVLLALFFISCKKENQNLSVKTVNDSIIGTWTNPQQSDSIVSFQRVDGLVHDNYGISILKDGKVIERKNAGWCGTPPVAYANFNGSWSMHDSIFEATVEYWGGTVDYKWKIVNVNNQSLKAIILLQKYNFTLGNN